MKLRHHILLAHVCLSLIASAQTHFSESSPLLGAGGEVLNPPLARIDITRQKAGPIPDLEPNEWTVAVWNFPAWNPGGKHWPELAEQKPLCIPLLYDSKDPKVRYRGTPTTARPTNASWIGILSGCGMQASIWSCLTGIHPSPKKPLIILLVTAILTTRSKSASSENPTRVQPH